MKALLLGSVIAAITLAAPSYAQNVLDVDRVLGPYLQIQEAVDAAASGDVIRVASGQGHSAVLISQKSLTLMALPGTPPVLGQLEIEDTDVDQHVIVTGFMVESDWIDPVLVDRCAGAVRFVDCRVRSRSFDGVVVKDSDDVTFQGVTVSAGAGSEFSYRSDGIVTLRSSVTLWDCEVRGSTAPLWAINGGAGVFAVHSDLFVHGSRLSGGRGGDSGFNWDGQCAGPGNGGNGVRTFGAGLVRLLDTELIPGAGGSASSCSGAGQSGVGIGGDTPVWPYAGQGLGLDFSTLSYESTALDVTASGPSEGIILLACGTQTARVHLPAKVGDLHVVGPTGGPRRILMGQGPSATIQLQLPELADSGIAQFYLQSVHLGRGRATFGPVRPLTVLDSAW